MDDVDSAAGGYLARAFAGVAALSRQGDGRGHVGIASGIAAHRVRLLPSRYFGGASPAGQLYNRLTGHQLAFSFEGLLVASILFNLPFAIQPMQRGFEAISREVRDAATCCGLTRWRILWRIELPLAWPGILSALVLTFAHTLGEFGVVLMIGGSIPGETKTIAISIYDRVQAFDTAGAGFMAATLLVISLLAIGSTYFSTSRVRARAHG